MGVAAEIDLRSHCPHRRVYPFIKIFWKQKIETEKETEIELRGNVLAVRAALDASGELRFEDLHRSNFMA